MWWEQVTTQPTYSGSLTGGGSHPAQLVEAGAPKSAALALLMTQGMLALERENMVKTSMKDPQAVGINYYFLHRFFKNVRLG